MSEIVIHGIPGSPYVRGALLGLEEKGAPYRFERMVLGEHKSEAYRRLHPFARVPVMEHDGYVLYETQAILRYVDALRPDPALQPAEPRAVGRMNQLVGVLDWYFFPQVTGTISWERLVVPMLGGTPNLEVVEAAIPNATTCVEALNELFAGPYLVGQTLTIADLMLAPHLEYFAATPEGARLLATSPLTGWLARMRERPSMIATAPERLRAAA